jgi:hypothetical protein
MATLEGVKSAAFSSLEIHRDKLAKLQTSLHTQMLASHVFAIEPEWPIDCKDNRRLREYNLVSSPRKLLSQCHRV